jgi:hypothetical protein
MEDVLVIEAERTVRGLRRSMFGMYRWVAAGKVMVFAIALWLIILAVFHQNIRRDFPVLAAIGGFVIAMLGMSVWQTLRESSKLAKKARGAGPLRFTATPASMRCDFDGDTLEVAWKNVHSMCVSSHTIYVFINRNIAWFIQRGDHERALFALARTGGVAMRGTMARQLAAESGS